MRPRTHALVESIRRSMRLFRVREESFRSASGNVSVADHCRLHPRSFLLNGTECNPQRVESPKLASRYTRHTPHPSAIAERFSAIPQLEHQRAPSSICRVVEHREVSCEFHNPPVRCLKVVSPTSDIAIRGFAEQSIDQDSLSEIIPQVQTLNTGFSPIPDVRLVAYRHVAISAFIQWACVVPSVEVRSLQTAADINLRIHQVNVCNFKITVHHFRFPEAREQRGLFPSPQRKGGSTASLPRVKPLAPPPEKSSEDLSDRLRWLLTPPVNQLVSDLCVPEQPFAFQLQGIQWLMDRESALLADEMGLGKTMQAILAARLLWRHRKIESVLVICPKSLLGNWKREIEKWWPDGWIHLREPGPDKRWFLRLTTTNVLVKLINYEALIRDMQWIEENNLQHDLVIIDEAQRIKSAGSKTAQSVKFLRGKRNWALTGTPLENSVDDLISIMEFVNPKAVTSVEIPQLRQAIGPYILRRRIDDPNIGIQLPEISVQDIEIELTDSQRRNYERVEQERVLLLNSQGDTVTVQHIFALIRTLTQLCNFDVETGESAKLDRLLEDFDEIAASEKKALVFSQFVSDAFGLRKLGQELQSHSYRVMELHGQIPQVQRDGIVHRFNSSPMERALLLNYSVGGVGLNLQSAGYVFLFDRWWNPAVEDQAIKRAHRIGQKDRVIVRRFFCKNTIEERILQVLAKKRRLFREVIDEERPHESMGLTQEELFSLFDLKVRPRGANVPRGLSQRRLDDLTPTEFEGLAADLYRAQGYHVEHTGGAGDGGIDVLAERKTPSGIERIAVQCKHVASNVGPEPIRSLWGTLANDSSLTVGVVITSAKFSPGAKAFARDKRITLVDRGQLKDLLLRFEVAQIIE